MEPEPYVPPPTDSVRLRAAARRLPAVLEVFQDWVSMREDESAHYLDMLTARDRMGDVSSLFMWDLQPDNDRYLFEAAHLQSVVESMGPIIAEDPDGEDEETALFLNFVVTLAAVARRERGVADFSFVTPVEEATIAEISAFERLSLSDKVEFVQESLDQAIVAYALYVATESWYPTDPGSESPGTYAACSSLLALIKGSVLLATHEASSDRDPDPFEGLSRDRLARQAAIAAAHVRDEEIWDLECATSNSHAGIFFAMILGELGGHDGWIPLWSVEIASDAFKLGLLGHPGGPWSWFEEEDRWRAEGYAQLAMSSSAERRTLFTDWFEQGPGLQAYGVGGMLFLLGLSQRLVEQGQPWTLPWEAWSLPDPVIDLSDEADRELVSLTKAGAE